MTSKTLNFSILFKKRGPKQQNESPDLYHNNFLVIAEAKIKAFVIHYICVSNLQINHFSVSV